ncbi:MAG: PepSY domain-containing protein [Clostridia bacterium]|nr:PepSY domain-containing protein [Clostridia bacterium]
MKKRLFTALVSAGLVLSVALLAGCADNKPQVEENVTVNQAQASAAEVKNEELSTAVPETEKVEAPVTEKAPENDKAPEKTVAPVAEENTTKKKADKNNNGNVSVEVAKQKALENAGVKAKDAVFVKAHYDYDDRVPHYDVEFYANGYEYEYEVRASDGAVFDKDVEREREPVKTTSAANDYISADKAKSAAFKHAKVKAADVKYVKAELDRDDRVVHYDVEFVAGRYEYEYEVNAETGKVLSYNKEFND